MHATSGHRPGRAGRGLPAEANPRYQPDVYVSVFAGCAWRTRSDDPVRSRRCAAHRQPSPKRHDRAGLVGPRRTARRWSHSALTESSRGCHCTTSRGVVSSRDGHGSRAGRPNPRAELAEGLERRQIEKVMREHGVESVHEVRLAVLETDASISVVPASSTVFLRPASMCGICVTRGRVAEGMPIPVCACVRSARR
jgi:hypothetical protein